ncbi:MAG TPA: hypothetical protein VMS37_31245, partial [Verrucomicrobiae bacterium]|nr:hypothetical protein [Verrucomicrobiae bacterium]
MNTRHRNSQAARAHRFVGASIFQPPVNDFKLKDPGGLTPMHSTSSNLLSGFRFRLRPGKRAFIFAAAILIGFTPVHAGAYAASQESAPDNRKHPSLPTPRT